MTLTVLGIEVSPALLAHWVDWLAPEVQPFYVTRHQAKDWDLVTDDREPTREQRDTYRVYRLDSSATHVAWLDEATYAALPKPTRAALVRAQVRHNRGAVPTVRRWHAILGPEVRRQADGHRFVWWKSLLEDRAEQVLPHVVSEDIGPSRHAEVREWPSTLPASGSSPGHTQRAAGPTASGPSWRRPASTERTRSGWCASPSRSG